MQPLGTKKTHAPSWDKKNMYYLGTKKSRNLSGQKNNATSTKKKEKLRNLLGKQKKSCNLL